MSDYLDSLNASDSGFLNAFVGPLGTSAQRGVVSRVGSDLPLAPENAGEVRGDLDRLLREVPTPDGLNNRLRSLIDSL